MKKLLSDELGPGDNDTFYIDLVQFFPSPTNGHSLVIQKASW